MKAKTTHIAIVILLLAGTTGITVSQHVCGDRYRYAQVAAASEENTCCETGAMPMDCCHNEIASAQITDAFSVVAQAQSVQTDAHVFILAVEDVFAALSSPPLAHEYAVVARESASLHGIAVPISVLNQSFLI